MQFSSVSDKTKDPCVKLRNELAQAMTQFQHCSIEYAVPVTMCHNCIAFYVPIVLTFKNFTTFNDPKTVRAKCSDRYMNQNALDIVWRQYQSSRDLWNSASCTSGWTIDKKLRQQLCAKVFLQSFWFCFVFIFTSVECFVDRCDPDKITNATDDQIASLCQPNKQIVYLQNLTTTLQNCLNQSDNRVGDACKDCATAFNALDGSYHAFQGDEICFEAVDQVNKSIKSITNNAID